MSLWSYGSDLSCLGRQSDVMEADEGESLTALTQQPARLLRSVASSQFVRVAAGGAHALAVTADGVLYSWGWNKYGQLGLGAASVGGSVQLPRQVAFLAGHEVGVIACGAAHSAVMAAADEVNLAGVHVGVTRCYTFGAHAAGQLGRGNQLELTHASPRPADVDMLQLASSEPQGQHGCFRAQPVACGAGHTAVLTQEGGLWTWGSNQHGQCGQQRTGGTATPGVVHALLPAGEAQRCVQVACGAAHTLVLTAEGRVYAFGLNATGQLGDGGCSKQPCPTPLLARCPAGVCVVQVCCGEEFSCAVTADGRLLTWGFGGCGQLGHGSALSLKLPKEVSCEAVDHVAAGMGHVLAATRTGGLLRWGLEAPWSTLVHEQEKARAAAADAAAADAAAAAAAAAADADAAAAAAPAVASVAIDADASTSHPPPHHHQSAAEHHADALNALLSVASLPRRVALNQPAPREPAQLIPVRCREVAAGRATALFVGEPVPLMESGKAVLLIQSLCRQHGARREVDERKRRRFAAKVLARGGTQWLARKTLRAAQEAHAAGERDGAALRMQAAARRQSAKNMLNLRRAERLAQSAAQQRGASPGGRRDGSPGSRRDSTGHQRPTPKRVGGGFGEAAPPQPRRPSAAPTEQPAPRRGRKSQLAAGKLLSSRDLGE